MTDLNLDLRADTVARMKVVADLADAPCPTPAALSQMADMVTELKAVAAGPTAAAVAPVIHRALEVTNDLAEKLMRQQERIEQLERMVETDEMTGLVNRRGFRRRLDQAVAAAGRYHDEGLLIYVDLDGFKRINDTYGHLAGDAVLMQTATLLKAKCRVEDTVARLGGDEFAVLMPKTEWAHGWSLARALEHLINQAHADWKGTKIPIRASIGYVSFDGMQASDTVVADADAQMYKRKNRKAQTRNPANTAA